MSKTSKFKKMLGLCDSCSGVPTAKVFDVPKPGQKIRDVPIKMEIVPSALFQLYVARVGQIDLVHSVRTDKRKMFAEALSEARIALEVYADQVKDEFQPVTVRGDEDGRADKT